MYTSVTVKKGVEFPIQFTQGFSSLFDIQVCDGGGATQVCVKHDDHS